MNQGIVFLPLAREDLKGWHEVAVNKIGAALARHSGQQEGRQRTSFVRSCLSH